MVRIRDVMQRTFLDLWAAALGVCSEGDEP